MEEIKSPRVFRLDSKKSKEEYISFLENNPETEILDTLKVQLQDYICSQHPSRKLSELEVDIYVEEKLGGIAIHDYGRWVYYPWSRRMVHLLDEVEFASLRTDRNKNKITSKEQAILSTKKIGLIGLSVGHAVATSLALERSFGELRIADFDVLDTSNLNRIRSGVQNIGLKKTSIVSREISELDPYLEVVCYDDGITEENLREFMASDGGLDLLIDECDSIDIKLRCREMAQELGIPVIMETSDRGMLDIERFDLDPSTPVLHGYLDGVDSKKLKGLTNEEKIPYVLPIIGIEKSSLRLRSSMFEVEKTISTWPQLGSDVVLGGGTIAHVARRILLGDDIPSGRTYVDLKDLIKSPIPAVSVKSNDSRERSVPIEEVRSKIASIAISEVGEKVPSDTIKEILSKAIQAPSGGNTQPWLWYVRSNDVILIMDTRKPFAFLDFKYRGSMVALGAASKNLHIAANHHGYSVKTDEFPLLEGEQFPLLARFSFGTLEVKSSPLFEFINKRQTNRLNEGRKLLPDSFKESMIQSFEKKGLEAKLRILESTEAFEKIKDVLSITDRLVMMNKQGHKDLFGELKWNKDFSEKDGINVNALGLTAMELSGMQIAKDPDVISNLRTLEGGDRFREMNHKAIDSSSAVGLITINSFSAEDFYKAGMSIQEHWLESTAQGVSIYPFTGGIYLMNRVTYGEGESLNTKEIEALKSCSSALKSLFSLEDDEVMAFLFRYSINTNSPIPSARKPLTEVILTDE